MFSMKNPLFEKLNDDDCRKEQIRADLSVSGITYYSLKRILRAGALDVIPF